MEGSKARVERRAFLKRNSAKEIEKIQNGYMNVIYESERVRQKKNQLRS